MIDATLARGWLRALAPPPIVAPTVFAESEIILPASANARPGPLRLYAYQREPIEAIADDEAEIIVLMLASQTGKSTVINAIMGHCIAAAPGPMLHVSPTGPNAEKFVRERLDPLIASSPALRALIGKGDATRRGSSGGVNSVSLKTFPGGSLAFASSFKPDELAARAIKYLFLDEVDRYASSAGVEGDPVELAIKRTKTYEGLGRKIIIVSTPTTRMGSRIGAWYARGDQRRFHVKCPDCDHSGPLAFECLKWTEGKPDTAHLACEECGVVIDEPKRRAMIADGKWVATATGERGIRSYHLDELSSLFSTMAAVAQQFDAAKTPEKKQSFYNTTLARVYDAGTEVELSASELEQRAERIVPPYNSNIQYVTCGIDVQSDRLECTFLAKHSDETFSVLNHLKLPGDTTGDAVWSELDHALGTVFPLADGRSLSLEVIAIDKNFSADQALKFVHAQRRKSRRIVPVIGRADFGRPSLTPSRTSRGHTRHFIVGVDMVKHALQKRLTMEEMGPGYIRLPDHLPPEYFEGLASEELRVKTIKGTPIYYHHRVVRKNEPFDCLVYATAIAGVVNVQATTAPATPGPSIRELAAKLNAAHNT